ncbi:MAG: hypothetical protein NTW86_20145 [Candidatus Sumerlaeota bacterium]|nr:hypothetical protein [Candidatus Sumerlaeota bacterium]
MPVSQDQPTPQTDPGTADSREAPKETFWRSRRHGIVFAALYFLVAAAALHPTIHGRDGLCNYAPLRSLLFDGDLDYANEYALFDRATDGAFAFYQIQPEPATGRPGNRYGIGSAILWSPFALAARAAGWARGRADMGLEPRYVWAVGVGSAFWAGAGLWLLFGFCRRRWGTNAAWIAAAAALGLSPLAFYSFFHTAMSHATAFFALTAFLIAWDRARRSGRRRSYALMGAMAGLAALVRIQDAAAAIAIFAWEAILIARGSGVWSPAFRRNATNRAESGQNAFRLKAGLHTPDPRAPTNVANRDGPLSPLLEVRRRAMGFALALVCGAVVFFPQMAVWRILYGSFFSGPAPYLREYPEFHLLQPIHAFEVLFSSNHGLFFWHPLLLIGLAGLASARRADRIAAIGLALAFLATWHLTASWQVWFAGASFGNRLYISILLVFAAGWAALYARAGTRRRRAALWIALALGVAWNAGLMAQYGLGVIPRQGEVSFVTLARNQFTVVPRLLWQRFVPHDRRLP